MTDKIEDVLDHRTAEVGPEQRTLATVLLDKTGSMAYPQAKYDATIEAFNAYIDGLKGSPIDCSLVLFNSNSIEKVYIEKPIDEVPYLTPETYVVDASTPLIDAAYKTIKAVEAQVSAKANKPKVIMAIQTDGEENCSTQHTFKELAALIKEKTEAGWHFVFLGASVDNFQQQQMYQAAGAMGITPGNTVSYNSNDLAATRASFGATASNFSGVSRGLLHDASFTMEQKAASGDVTDPGLIAPKQPKGKNDASKAKAPPIVDDFSLTK